MKLVRDLLDKAEGRFAPGGPLAKLYPVFEALDGFLYTPGKVTTGHTHVRDGIDLKRAMGLVVVALIPCIYMAMWNTGYQANLALAQTGTAMSGWRAAVLAALGVGHDAGSLLANLIHGALYFVPVYVVCMAAGGLWEVLFSVVRRHEINEGFLVTGMLFPLTLPPTIPLWQVALGISFGVVLGKEVFGGTGRNFLNPALTARAFLYFAYPGEISGDAVWVAVDGVSRATGLMAGALGGLPAIVASHSWLDYFLGTVPGSMGETSTLACLIGAVVLVVTGVGSWRIMVGMTAGALGLAEVLYRVGSPTNPMFGVDGAWHLVLGGFAFGVVFMATDPVSAAMTDVGRWIYGLLIGVMTVLIRVINPAFPEGVMLAILFGNVFAPVIDHFVVQANIRRRLARTAA